MTVIWIWLAVALVAILVADRLVYRRLRLDSDRLEAYRTHATYPLLTLVGACAFLVFVVWIIRILIDA